MEKKQRYVFAITDRRPDFIGLLKEETETELRIERPFIVEYQNFIPYYSTEFMPLGWQPNYEDDFQVVLEKRRILYAVHMDESHEIVQKYLEKVEDALHPERALEELPEGEIEGK